MALALDPDYRSDRARIGRDVVGPLLRSAVAYDRAVGFFSSTAFGVLGPALSAFFEEGGQMRLVCSHRLEPRDLPMVARAITERSQVRALWPSVKEAFRSQKWSAVLAYLIATDRLRMRIAVPVDAASSRRMYHEKIAVVRDRDSNAVAVSGSANESATGLAENFERIDVFPSWTSDSEKKRCWRIEEHFTDLWGNRTEGVCVMDLFEAFRRNVWVVSESNDDAPERDQSESSIPSIALPPEVLVPPTTLKLKPHQKLAIEEWAKAGGRGMLEMATGSGKTLTALSLASRLSDRLPQGLAVVIIAPLIHLVDQWCEVASTFGLSPVRCAESTSTWSDELDTAISSLNAGGRPILSVVATGDALTSDRFQAALRRIQKPALIVADEVHNYGARSRLEGLPQNFPLRLGLSATPVRWHDDDGTKALEAYFGPVVFRYSLKEAIAQEVLTPYRYFPELAELDHEELTEYLELTSLIAKYVHGDEEGEVSEAAKRLLIRRARLLAGVRSKIPLLRTILLPRRSDSHILVYCGDGSVTGPDDGSMVRQVEEVVRLLGTELKMRVAPYLSETKPLERRRLLTAFSSGDLQALVAIRCLDEGVDVPVARTGILLASSTNPRQFIQRRGRLLRTAPGKARAEIFDLFAVPSLRNLPRDTREWKMARGILSIQLRRAQEFADLAENGPVARSRLLSLCEKMDLLSSWETT